MDEAEKDSSAAGLRLDVMPSAGPLVGIGDPDTEGCGM